MTTMKPEYLKHMASVVNSIDFTQFYSAMDSISAIQSSIDLINDSGTIRMINSVSLDLEKMQSIIGLVNKNMKLLPTPEVYQNLIATTLNSGFINTLINASTLIQKIHVPSINISKIIGEWEKETHETLGVELQKTGQNYYNRWEGCWQTFNSNNPEKTRQCTHSMRELFTVVLDNKVDETKIMKLQHCKKGDITRRQRLEYIFRNIPKEKVGEFSYLIETAMDSIKNLNALAHSRNKKNENLTKFWLHSMEGVILQIIKQENYQ